MKKFMILGVLGIVLLVMLSSFVLGDSVCGNGVMEGTEECDLGNLNSDYDSECTSLCKLNVCGDGLVWAGEELCDDGNLNNGDGCASGCMIESGYLCMFSLNQPSICTLASLCGNGIKDGGELCDTNDFGGKTCVSMGFFGGNLVCVPHCDTIATQSCIWINPLTCGNGQLDLNEQCDDGNTLGGDGCSSGCKTEPLYICSGAPSVCNIPNCGDGLISSNEVCDSNSLAGQTCITKGFAGGTLACAATCLSFDISGCMQGACGDGLLNNPWESCDDGNTVSNDGCSAGCTVETQAGYACSGIPSVCCKCGGADTSGLTQSSNDLVNGIIAVLKDNNTYPNTFSKAMALLGLLKSWYVSQ